jgi:hypothetical protein
LAHPDGRHDCAQRQHEAKRESDASNFPLVHGGSPIRSMCMRGGGET